MKTPENKTMDIKSKRGDKVMVTEETAKNGTYWDQHDLQRHLKIGKVYIIREIKVGGFRTRIRLEGIAGCRSEFNSVNFVNVDGKTD